MKVWVDSSFDEFRKVAGIGLYIEDGARQKVVSNWIPCPTNNYAELYAIYIGAILTHGQEAQIYTDSEAALDYVFNRVRNHERTPAQYRTHQMMRVLAYKIRALKPKVDKVKAHTREYKLKEIGSNMADMAARQGRGKYYNTLIPKRGKSR